MCVKRPFHSLGGVFHFYRKEVSIVMFYNGFNLLIDLILALVVGYSAYQMGNRDGWQEAREFHKIVARSLTRKEG